MVIHGCTTVFMRFTPNLCRAHFASALFAALALSLTAAPAAHAAAPLTNCTDPGGVLSNGNATCTFTVTTNGDSVDVSDPTNYVALAGSLRRAILDANAWGNYGNTVAGNSVIDANALGGQTITIATSLPLIASNLSIVGPSAGLTIAGINNSRCLFVSGLPTANQIPGGNDGAPQAINVSLSNLGLTRCNARAGSGHTSGLAAGGALFVNQNATVSLSNVAFQSNQAQALANQDPSANGGGGMGSSSTSDSGGGLGGDVVTRFVQGGMGIGSDPSSGQCTSGFCSGGGFGGRGLGQISARQGFSQAIGNGGLNGGGGGTNGGNGHGSGVGGSGNAGGGINGVASFCDAGVGGGGCNGSGGGAGGFGGGGGPYGNGGFGGGGGGQYRQGGFGGGGGMGGGNGGFGGGGGASSGGSIPSIGASIGGFAGGAGDPAPLSIEGGTGAALGGALFVMQGGSVVFAGTMAVSGSALTTRAAGGGATSGAGLGKGIFLEGSSTLTFAPGAGSTQTISDDIADQRGSWPALGITAQAFYTTGGVFRNPPVDGSTRNYWSYSNDGRWSMVKNGAGSLLLSGVNTFSGAANAINAGTLQVDNSSALGFGSWSNAALLKLTAPANTTARQYAVGNVTGAVGMPAGNFTQTATGNLSVAVYPTATANVCQPTLLNVRDAVTLAGNLHIEVVGGCVARNPRRYAIINAKNTSNLPGTGSNKFTSVTLAGFPSGLGVRLADVTYDNTAATRIVNITISAVPCSAGTYSGSGNGPTCTDASAGYYVATVGAMSQTACAPGSYQPLTGQIACLSADAGSFVSASAAIAQTVCVAGTYQPNPGQSNCVDATPGNFVVAGGAISQTQCTAGTYSSAVRAISCTPASAGFYVPTAGASSQTACPFGSTSSAGAVLCTRLPLLNIDDSDAPDVYSASTDGTLLLRYLLGLRGTALTAGALGTNARRDAAQIVTHIETYITLFDVDGDGQTRALTDGVMILRRMLGLSGSALTAGAKNSARTDDAVRDAIDALKP
jgi:hypothetical protein